MTLYDFPDDHVGRKRYVGVRGHTKSVPAFKTYRGVDGYNHILPEHGGTLDGMGSAGPLVLSDKAAYWSPLDGTVVEGRTAHRDHMKRHNVLEAGDYKIGDISRSRDTTPRGIGDDIRRTISELS